MTIEEHQAESERIAARLMATIEGDVDRYRRNFITGHTESSNAESHAIESHPGQWRVWSAAIVLANDAAITPEQAADRMTAVLEDEGWAVADPEPSETGDEYDYRLLDSGGADHWSVGITFARGASPALRNVTVELMSSSGTSTGPAMTSAQAVQSTGRAKSRARGCLTSFVVVVVVVALLLAWLNHEITTTLNGDKAAAQFERAQDRFGDRAGVLSMYHDEFGNTTMELAPVAVVTEEYEDLSQDAASYFERRNDGEVTLRIDQTELTLEDDDDAARRLGLRLVDQLRSFHGLQEVSISAAAHRATVQVYDDLDRSALSLYRDVQEACAVVAPGEDVSVSVTGWGVPRGHISDELDYDNDAGEDQDRSADLSREIAIYQRYASTYEVVGVYIRPADVSLTINENAADARSEARRDSGSSGIEIEIETDPPEAG